MANQPSTDPRAGLPSEVRQRLEEMDTFLESMTPDDRTAVLRMLFDDINRKLTAAGLEPVNPNSSTEGES